MIGPIVVKIGGSTLGDADTTFADLAEMARAGDVPIVVHGGGAEANRWLEAMAIPSRFERGLRVTDDRVLPVVVAVFAGLVNKRIVAAINGAGGRAVGLCGADGRTLECALLAPELGFVGEPVRVNAAAVLALHAAGFMPVIGPIGCVPGEGADQLVNINADTVAGNIAAAVGARQLVFLTDIDGVRGPENTVAHDLSESLARQWLADGTIGGGMIPKVEACLHALALGVPVQIVDGRRQHSLRNMTGAGTTFTR